jgi:hypothetical protein
MWDAGTCFPRPPFGEDSSCFSYKPHHKLLHDLLKVDRKRYFDIWWLAGRPEKQQHQLSRSAREISKDKSGND